ncbi:PLP-dependent aminotransferase family protein [Calidifontibacter sp. DB0510]|uniref:PLP-dependent aminotransferase family protein n=1 Tax=Metallococcus carri TaxID=1656884 RepID=A0A967AZH8_9MICO|nr:PLP-dependent aminotransferase family protein [Metallococcus carri]NHN54680.1 PLP-dependent aminotransferase family protein [Metallococcus carri]NOP37025.1 PLP-dependent aminotransferase family protein [Calidifontibacter sp. DB2511S]
MTDGSSWEAIARELADEVAPLPPGRRIPTQRELVARYGVSATTVARAVAAVAASGLIESQPGAGTFRSAKQAARNLGDTSWQEAALDLDGSGSRDVDAIALGATVTAYGPEVADLNAGYLHPELQPTVALGRALSRAGRRTDAWQRPDPAGLPELRDHFAAQIGAGLSRHDLLVVAGGQAGLSLALRAVGMPGDPVVIESPTYPGTLAAAQAAGLRPVPVPVDAEGLRLDDLEQALVRTKARVIVVQPLFQNPTGVTLSVGRQRDLLELATQHGAFVIEDDFARQMAHADARPLPPPLIEHDTVGTVLHLRSLTKVTSPNLRVAAIAARGPVLARLRAAHIVDAMFVPAPLQFTALELLTAASWQRTIRSLAGNLTERRSAALAAVTERLPQVEVPHVPRGGYHLWLRLPADRDPRQLAAVALVHGVAVTPGSNYYATANPAPHLRLSYIGVPSVPDVVTGIERLARAFETR